MFKRIIIPLFMIIALSLSSCSQIIYTKKTTSAKIKNNNKNNTITVDKSKLEGKRKLSPYYNRIVLNNGYKTLKNESEKRIYKAIIAHSKDFVDKKLKKRGNSYLLSSFTLTGIKTNRRQIAKSVFAVFQDNPVFFWMDEPYSYSIGKDFVTIKLFSNMNLKQYKKKNKQLNSVINKLLSGLKKGMSEFERELYFHDYLVKNCKYIEGTKENKDSFTLYGCLVNQSAVCMGYTSAFQLLLSYAGINSIAVNGSDTASGHIWNAVKIDGKWYYTDVTWDDTDDFFMYDNFNITGAQLRKTHNIVKRINEFSDSELFEKDGTIKNANLIIPKCTAVKYNYYKYKGYNLKSENDNHMAKSLAKYAKAKKPYFYIYVNPKKFDYNSVYGELFDSKAFGFVKYIRTANAILGYNALKTSVSVTKKNYLNTITVELKYN